MLHVPDIRRNLVSGSLLVQVGYKIILQFNKIVISKSDIFIEKIFVSKGLFKLNIISSSINENSFIPSQSLMLNFESCGVWHCRLGHMNFKSISKDVQS